MLHMFVYWGVKFCVVLSPFSMSVSVSLYQDVSTVMSSATVMAFHRGISLRSINQCSLVLRRSRWNNLIPGEGPNSLLAGIFGCNTSYYWQQTCRWRSRGTSAESVQSPGAALLSPFKRNEAFLAVLHLAKHWFLHFKYFCGENHLHIVNPKINLSNL